MSVNHILSRGLDIAQKAVNKNAGEVAQQAQLPVGKGFPAYTLEQIALMKQRSVEIYESMPGILKFFSPGKNAGVATRKNIEELNAYVSNHPEVQTNPVLKSLKDQLEAGKNISPEIKEWEKAFQEEIGMFFVDGPWRIAAIKDEKLRQKMFDIFILSKQGDELQDALKHFPGEVRENWLYQESLNNLSGITSPKKMYCKTSLNEFLSNFNQVADEENKKELAEKFLDVIQSHSLGINNDLLDNIQHPENLFELLQNVENKSKVYGVLEKIVDWIKTPMVLEREMHQDYKFVPSFAKVILGLKNHDASLALFKKLNNGSGDNLLEMEFISIMAKEVANSDLNPKITVEFANRLIDYYKSHIGYLSTKININCEDLLLKIEDEKVKIDLLDKLAASIEKNLSKARYNTRINFQDLMVRAISSLKDVKYKDEFIEKLFASGGQKRSIAISSISAHSDKEKMLGLIEPIIAQSDVAGDLSQGLKSITDQSFADKVIKLIISNSKSCYIGIVDLCHILPQYSDDAFKVSYLKENLKQISLDLNEYNVVEKIITSIKSDKLKEETAKFIISEVKKMPELASIRNEMILHVLKFVNDENLIISELKSFSEVPYGFDYSSIIKLIKNKNLINELTNSLPDNSLKRCLLRVSAKGEDGIEANPLFGFFLDTFEQAYKKINTDMTMEEALNCYKTFVNNGNNPSLFAKGLSDCEEFYTHVSKNAQALIPEEMNTLISYMKQADSMEKAIRLLDANAFDSIDTEGLRVWFRDLGINSNPNEIFGDYEKMDKTQIIKMFKKPFTSETRNKILTALYDRVIQDVKKSFKERKETVFNAITISGLGNVKDMAAWKAAKFNTYLANVREISNVPDLAKVVSQTFAIHKLNSVMGDRLIKLAESFEKFEKKDEFIFLLNKMNETKVLDLSKLSKEFFKLVAVESKISGDQIAKITQEQMNLWDFEQMPAMGVALKFLEDEPKSWLLDLFKTTLEGNYWQYLFENGTKIGDANRLTVNMFKENGLDYTKWLKYNGVKDFSFATNYQQQLNAIVCNIATDLAELMQDTKLTPPLLDKINKLGFHYENGSIKTLSGEPISKEAAQTFLSRLDKELLQGYWVSLRTKGQELNANIKNHMAERIRDLGRLTNISKSEDLTIELWKRQPGHDLFQGSYCQCCIALDGCNRKSIVESLVNTIDQIAEIKTPKGDTIGKIKMFWVKDLKTKKPILVINGFEMSSGYQDKLEVRKAALEFARDYAKAVTGKSDTKIYMGKSYNDVPIADLASKDLNVQLIGKATNDEYYFDALQAGQWSESLSEPKKVSLFVF